MKKKSRFLVHIALIALSLCIMVYGVYAAKSASLTVSGTIGFTAHGVEGKITSVAVAGALDQNSGTYTDSAITTTEKDLKDITFTNSMYFNDIPNSTATKDVLEDIVITINFKNYSLFDLYVKEKTGVATGVTNVTYDVKVTYGSGDKMVKATKSGATVTPATGNTGTCEIKITLKYTGTSDTVASFTAGNFSTVVEFTNTKA